MVALVTRSHTPYPPPINLAPVDAYRLHLHLLAYYQQTGQAILHRSDLAKWPAAMGMSRTRFLAALTLLSASQHVRSEKAGKVTFIHLLRGPVIVPPSTVF